MNREDLNTPATGVPMGTRIIAFSTTVFIATALPLRAEDVEIDKNTRQITRMLGRQYCPVRSCSYPLPSTVLRFAINSAGRLQWIEMIQPSGTAAKDHAVIKAIRDASPFISLPDPVTTMALFEVTAKTPSMKRDPKQTPYHASHASGLEITGLPIENIVECRERRLVWSEQDALNRETLHCQFKMGLRSVRKEDYRQAASHFAKCVEINPNCLAAKINIDLCNYANKFSPKTFQPANREMSQWGVTLEEIWGPEGDDLARRRTYVNNHNEDVRGHKHLAHAVYKLLRKNPYEPHRR